MTNSEQLAALLGVTNVPAFLTGHEDGLEQGMELSSGMSYEDETDQWCYDIGSLIGGALSVKPQPNQETTE